MFFTTQRCEPAFPPSCRFLEVSTGGRKDVSGRIRRSENWHARQESVPPFMVGNGGRASHSDFLSFLFVFFLFFRPRKCVPIHEEMESEDLEQLRESRETFASGPSLLGNRLAS